MSDFAELDDWLTTTVQAPVSRQMRPITEPIRMPTPVLVGYIVLWHNRTCNACGSEHLELCGTYECYLHPSGARNLRLCGSAPEDTPLPVLNRSVQRTAAYCGECRPPEFNAQQAAAVLGTFESLLT